MSSDISFSNNLIIGKNQIANYNINEIIEMNKINKTKISSDEYDEIEIDNILREF